MAAFSVAEGEKQMMRKLMGVMAVVALASPVLLLGQAPDATKVLADMQAALGGAEQLAAVKTLTAEGVIQRVRPRGMVEFTVELAMALPDKYVTRTQLTNQGNMSVYRNLGFNGEGFINRNETPPNLAAAGRDRLRSDRAAMVQTDEQRAEMARLQFMNVKGEFARAALALFGASHSGFPVQIGYAGLAESPDGNAHVLGAQGADGFEVRLFVSADTHMPLMMAWSQTLPRNPETPREHRMYYSNFKSVDGVSLAHTWRHTVDGEVTDETIWGGFTINPEIDSKTFEVSR
jgi:hypothetical protein